MYELLHLICHMATIRVFNTGKADFNLQLNFKIVGSIWIWLHFIKTILSKISICYTGQYGNHTPNIDKEYLLSQ